MNSTQEHLTINDISDDYVLLKDGSAAIVLQTSAVNFGLLSEMEQVAIIDNFAQMLNSLSFSIQIAIHSKRLDITSYIRLLDKAQANQTNPLLSQMMARYKQFIQSTVKENDVLDKRFYIVILVSFLELGLGFFDKQTRIKKARTILIPRRDQIIRQLNRVGLKADQLTSKQLFELFFEIYNFKPNGNQFMAIEPIRLANPAVTHPSEKPQDKALDHNFSGQTPIQSGQKPKHHPFVVEELTDSI